MRGGRAPGPTRLVPGRLLALLLTGVLTGVLAGCSGSDEEPGSDPSPGSSGSTSPDSSGGASAGDSSGASGEVTRAPEPPRPQAGSCYRLGYQQAIDPVVAVEPVPCRRAHTARTFAVGDLPTVVDGHLVAVDSARARAQPARACPRRLAGFLGGSVEDQRLSMFETVWFTPTLAQAEQGANWFRCDVVALAADRRLASLEGRLAGVLARPSGSERYGMCGTDEPGTSGFERVACVRAHSWRAVGVVPLRGLAGDQGGYPGVGAVREQGQGPCEQTGRQRAADPLDFQWGYEWPSRQDWADGTTWGYCWVPDSA